jgi:DNA-binding MurR/RpiR family transcriptional regulator
MSLSEVAERIEARRDALSPTERQVAEVVLRDPESVAFGTVARVADAASTSGASVVRLATRLGYPGFSGLQAAVQSAIGQQLRPAVERIRGETGSDVVDRTLRAEVDNVHRTLAAVAPEDFGRAVELLADRRRAVVVVAGDAETGVGAMFATALALVRDGVAQVSGSDVAVARQLAGCGPDTVVVALDLRRYERWVVDAVGRAVDAGATAVAVTDSPLSPLAARAAVSFVVSAEGAGVFDSHVGMLALTNALVTATAARLRRSAARRLDAVESAWRAAEALVDR